MYRCVPCNEIHQSPDDCRIVTPVDEGKRMGISELTPEQAAVLLARQGYPITVEQGFLLAAEVALLESENTRITAEFKAASVAVGRRIDDLESRLREAEKQHDDFVDAVAEAIGLKGDDAEDAANWPYENLLPQLADLRNKAELADASLTPSSVSPPDGEATDKNLAEQRTAKAESRALAPSSSSSPETTGSQPQ